MTPASWLFSSILVPQQLHRGEQLSVPGVWHSFLSSWEFFMLNLASIHNYSVSFYQFIIYRFNMNLGSKSDTPFTQSYWQTCTWNTVKYLSLRTAYITRQPPFLPVKWFPKLISIYQFLGFYHSVFIGLLSFTVILIYFNKKCIPSFRKILLPPCVKEKHQSTDIHSS